MTYGRSAKKHKKLHLSIAAEEHRSGRRTPSLFLETEEKEYGGDEGKVAQQCTVYWSSGYCMYQHESLLPEMYTFIRRGKFNSL